MENHINTEELEKWWSHLPIRRNKGVKDEHATKEEVMNEEYPACTKSWDLLDPIEKQMLYNRFGGRTAHLHHTHPKGNTSLT